LAGTKAPEVEGPIMECHSSSEKLLAKSSQPAFMSWPVVANRVVHP